MAGAVEQATGRASGWERRFEWAFQAAPYLLLTGSSLLSLLQVDQSWGHRLATLGLAAVGALWVLLTYTLRSPSWRRHPAAMLLYFAGMLSIAWMLQARSFFFLAFTITGFIQPFLLLPAALGFLVVAASSVVVFTASAGFPAPTVEAWTGYLFIIALQTAASGFFGFMGAKLNDEHQQRQQLVADLEAADRVRGLPDELGRHLEQARSLARESLTEARRSVQALRPEPLEGSRLPDAIASMARRWSETSRVALTLETTGEPRPILAELEATLFRVAQEALTNVGKHAGASKVGLTLSYLDDEVLLDVRDDGAGFHAGRLDGKGNGGFGLRGMRQRLRRVAGNLEIESAPGEGTAINASVPAIPAEGGG